MKIALITPEPPADNAGNETTSRRWREILSRLGHAVEVAYEYEALKREPDALVALHALKSDPAIRSFHDAHPDRLLVVALTGTDLYRYRRSHPEVDRNIDRADALVVLQREALEELPSEVRSAAFVIHQSVGLLDEAAAPDELPVVWSGEKRFEVCVAAHLRDVKDPLRTGRAARRLPEDSTLGVTHVGRALDEEWGERGRREREENPRYEWLGEVPRDRALGIIRRSDLLSVTSRLEGGPNVISEAVALGTPVVASRIPGNVGLLGPDYPGYFDPEETEELAEVLGRAESDGAFYRRLVDHVESLQPRYTPERERAAWRELFESLGD